MLAIEECPTRALKVITIAATDRSRTYD